MSVHIAAWAPGDFTEAATILNKNGTEDKTGLVFSHHLSHAICLAHIFLQI